MGERHTDRRGAPGRRRHPGHDLKADAMGMEVGRLLAAASEQIGIAALETNHAASGARQAHEQGVDFILWNRVALGLFADADPRRSVRNQGHDLIGDQPVVHHDIGLVQQTSGLEC